MDLLSRVRRYIEREQLAPAGARILIALSGGADSVALLFLLRELAAAGDLAVAGAAHLNHQLRGRDADDDEAFAAALAERLRLPFRSARVDVGALARARRRSIEETARCARYRFLEQAADDLAAGAIAVAHTRDDQAETFLLRLLRGAGARGLGAIRPRAGRVVRPLLDVRRAELREYLASIGEPFREDPSNADVAIPRNRVRHELLPLLSHRFSPAVVDVLARDAALARQDDECLQQLAAELTSRAMSTPDAETVALDAAMLSSAPRALASRVALAALERVGEGRAVGHDHVAALLELASRSSGALSLPGQTAVRSGASVVLRRGEPGPPNSFAFPLSIPGEVQLASARLAVGIEKLPGPAARLREWVATANEVGVASESLRLPLAVRSRRPGDRFQPLGAPGVRKLHDFLIDRKVPRAERDTLPLVVDASDRIVWVVGQSVAEDFRVTDSSRGVLLLKVRHLGGPG